MTHEMFSLLNFHIFAESLSTKQPFTPVVGFHVALSKRWSGSGKIPFDRILSNYGNGWDNITHLKHIHLKHQLKVFIYLPSQS